MFEKAKLYREERTESQGSVSDSLVTKYLHIHFFQTF